MGTRGKAACLVWIVCMYVYVDVLDFESPHTYSSSWRLSEGGAPRTLGASTAVTPPKGSSNSEAAGEPFLLKKGWKQMNKSANIDRNSSTLWSWDRD